MPTTSLITPQALMPGYNPIIYTFTSTTNTQTGFRYLVDVYSGTGTTTSIARLKVTPTQFGDGYIDIGRILQNYVSDSHNFGFASTGNLFPAYLNYSVRLGEEFVSSWNYTAATSAATGTFAGFTVLLGTSASTYIAGDQINITTTPSGQSASINGLQNILSAGTNQNIINLRYPAPGFTIILTGGTTTYADLRKIQFTGQTVITGTSIFNGALDWPAWKTWVAANYVVQSATSNTDFVLSSLKPASDVTSKYRQFYMTPSQDIWLNFYTDIPTNNFSWTRTWFDKNNVSKGGLTIPIAGGGNVRQFKMGFNTTTALNPVEGDYIQFRVINTTTGLPVTRPYNIYADVNCPREEVQLYYQDRLGSILSQAFTLNSTQKVEIERDVIKKAIIYGSNASLDLSQAGSIVTNSDINRTYELATNWLTDAQIELIEELISSRYVWMLVGSDYLPVIVQDKGYEVTYQRNKRLQRKNVTVTLANQRPLN